MKEFIEFTKIVKELRLTYGYSQVYVASRLGIAHASYHAYESGRALPSLENFIKLANLYDVSLDYLVGKSDII